MLNRALLYGGLAALLTFLWTLGEWALGLHGPYAEVGRWSGFLAIAFPILAITLALRALRAERGMLSMSDGIKQGLATSFMFALLGAFGTWAYFVWINPGFRDAGRAVDPMAQVSLVLTSGLVLGLLISLVASVLLRTRTA